MQTILIIQTVNGTRISLRTDGDKIVKSVTSMGKTMGRRVARADVAALIADMDDSCSNQSCRLIAINDAAVNALRSEG
jgi:hypothetical protein